MIISVDLRKRVITSIEKGMKIKDAAEIYQISAKSINNWQKLKQKTNLLDPKKDYQNGHSHKIKDWDLFIQFAEEYKELTLEEMAEKWTKKFNEKISKSTIRRALKNCNYTFKKKHLPIQNQIKKSKKNFWKKLKT
jgi:transposase